ncbi:LysR family transcriptional regulator [Pseudochrobactrum algeriensis]|uniref:helix-turn-helix domain-containing protein n=1 Tax=Pseudochrobactrum algeriensis TaxID=2834768 RepID=UPI001BCF3DC4|nr:LysR family transcriptional regulator [Pseudochrobactrum algeriensis]
MGKVLPLLALRAFTETGRTGSIKSAAEMMGVTSGAVSQQIRLLEERTGRNAFQAYPIWCGTDGSRGGCFPH